MKKLSGRTRVRKNPSQTDPPGIDAAIREAFVKGVGVPRSRVESVRARELVAETRKIRTERFDGVIWVSKGQEPKATPPVHPLTLLTETEAAVLEPTAPESMAAQCDGLGRLADRMVPRLANLRASFVVAADGLSSKGALVKQIEALDELARAAVQLRNCVAIYAADL